MRRLYYIYGKYLFDIEIKDFTELYLNIIGAIGCIEGRHVYESVYESQPCHLGLFIYPFLDATLP